MDVLRPLITMERDYQQSRLRKLYISLPNPMDVTDVLLSIVTTALLHAGRISLDEKRSVEIVEEGGKLKLI